MPNTALVPGSITLPAWQWHVLKAAAHARQKREGRRASVSALIAELVKERRPRLEERGRGVPKSVRPLEHF
jgi:hypothetical protein